MNYLIVEDEPLAAKRLIQLVQALRPDWSHMQSLDSVVDTVAWLDSNKPELAFFDVQLADGLSFELFQHLDIDFPVIFTTAYDNFAINALRVNAIDYLLKPVKSAELEDALDRLQDTLSPALNYDSIAEQIMQIRAERRFMVRRGSRIFVIHENQAAYFYVKDKITYLVNFEGDRYAVDYTLDKLEEMLKRTTHFRINRQMITHIDAIAEMFSYTKSRVKLKLRPAFDEPVIVSTDRSPIFKKWLTGS
jgi:two-component system, LytTR family, response regulator LytT